MEKDKIFFGENGLTSTSANFIANMAKEYVQNIQDKLNDLNPFTKTIGIIGGNSPTIVEMGITSVEGLEKKLDSVSKAYSLIAWLREAIKAKQNLTNELNRYKLEDYCKDNNIDYPEKPKSPSYLTEDDVIATWNIKERNRYYYLGTKVAEYGKFIHPNQPFALMRKKLSKHQQEWVEYEESGRDTIITDYTPTIPLKDVDKEFYILQKIWREAQAELNGMKHKIQLILDEDCSTKNAAYSTQLREYTDKISVLNAQYTEAFQEKMKRINNLKIVIPNDLIDIYNEVKSLTK